MSCRINASRLLLENSGFQYHTRWRIGLSCHSIMLDGGSAVNSTTEELVLRLLNEKEAAGIKLNEKKHPVKQLKRWNHAEGLREIAGGAAMPLLGSVVVNVSMLASGGGKTDWVGWVVGARALDCCADGGLGFIPLQNTHHFPGPNVWCERAEPPRGSEPDSCSAIKASSLDGAEDTENN